MRLRKKKPKEISRTDLRKPAGIHQQLQDHRNAAAELCFLVAEASYEASDAFPPLKSALGLMKKVIDWSEKSSSLKESICILKQKANNFLEVLAVLEPQTTAFSPEFLYAMESVRSEMQFILSETRRLEAKSAHRGLFASGRRVLNLRKDNISFGQLKERFISSSEVFDRTCQVQLILFTAKMGKAFTVVPDLGPSGSQFQAHRETRTETSPVNGISSLYIHRYVLFIMVGRLLRA